jgi:hypothetical protein
MLKGVVLAVALQLAQAPASDGQIHITCTTPSDVAARYQIIVQPIQKVAWVNPSSHLCEEDTYTGPAEVTEGTILIHITCKETTDTTISQTITIDRYTGSYVLVTKENARTLGTLTGQCVSSQKQLF